MSNIVPVCVFPTQVFLAATTCQSAPLTDVNLAKEQGNDNNNVVITRKLTVILPHGVYCPTKGSYSCLNGKECLNVSMICDGHAHCRDGSDEMCADITPVDQISVNDVAPNINEVKIVKAAVNADVKTTTCQSQCAGAAAVPVCDESTNTQYDNSCLATCAGVSTVVGLCGQDVSTDQPCTCEQIYAPVCGANLETYPNACYADCDGQSDYTSGVCPSVSTAPPGCTCSEIYDPVCGYNGATYSNPCEAECVGEQYTTGACGTVMPTGSATSGFWKIVIGAGICSISSDGRCVSDMSYKNDDQCTVQALTDIVVSSTSFSTEDCCECCGCVFCFYKDFRMWLRLSTIISMHCP